MKDCGTIGTFLWLSFGFIIALIYFGPDFFLAARWGERKQH